MRELPKEFVQRMRQQLGVEAEEFFNALSQRSQTSIRLHHLKGRTSFSGLEHVPWCEDGYYLGTRPYFHLDPHWHGGAYYVQEASSMILDNVISQLSLDQNAKIWLDMCAAPGGKTGILAKHKGPNDILLANEVVPQRRAILRENLYKAGYINTFITGEQSKSFNEPFAEIILIDAPCAGEGMMRKEPEAIRQWSTGLVRECSLMQQRIVTDVARALKPGGYLIYSTCSYSQAENMDNVKSFVKMFPLTCIQLKFPMHWNITVMKSDGVTGYQLYPHKVKGEGLFFSVLQNNSSEKDFSRERIKKQTSEFVDVHEWLKPKLNESEKLRLRKNSLHNSFITASAEEKANEVLNRFPKVEIVAEAGELKGKDFIPSHFLAMSSMHHNDHEKILLPLNQSLDYLERNTHSLPTGIGAGWHLVQFDESCLGWAKLTPQGWKNHYPLNWRLRSRKMS